MSMMVYSNAPSQAYAHHYIDIEARSIRYDILVETSQSLLSNSLSVLAALSSSS